jgi:hypothetical protein
VVIESADVALGGCRPLLRRLPHLPSDTGLGGPRDPPRQRHLGPTSARAPDWLRRRT